MPMTPLEELRNLCSHVLATADALRKELAAAGWSMLDGKEGYKLEPLKKP